MSKLEQQAADRRETWTMGLLMQIHRAGRKDSLRALYSRYSGQIRRPENRRLIESLIDDRAKGKA